MQIRIISACKKKRKSSAKSGEYEVDAVGVVVPKLWVVEVKFTHRRIGVQAI